MLSLHTSDLRPLISSNPATVQLWATWSGPWPAQIDWKVGYEGQWYEIDKGKAGIFTGTSDGTTATFLPEVEGSFQIKAGSEVLTLQTRKGSVDEPQVENREEPESPRPPKIEPLPEVESHCRDDRFPALAGSWVVWCSGPDKVDRAMNLLDRKVVEIDGPENPGLGPGVLYAPGPGKGLWQLPATRPPIPLVAQTGIAPPATDGKTAVIPYATEIQIFPFSAKTRATLTAFPIPQQSVAVAGNWAAWTEQGGLTQEDVWLSHGTSAEPWARGEASERWVVGDGSWLAWVDDRQVFVEDLERHERRRYPAKTGFLHGPSLWGPVACWEERGMWIRCSDGMQVRRETQQFAPSRWGPWLLWHEEGRVMLATASSLRLDQQDPRYRDGSWSFDWPAPDWRWETWGNGMWNPMGTVQVGPVQLSAPDAVAIRLVAP